MLLIWNIFDFKNDIIEIHAKVELKQVLVGTCIKREEGAMLVCFDRRRRRMIGVCFVCDVCVAVACFAGPLSDQL